MNCFSAFDSLLFSIQERSKYTAPCGVKLGEPVVGYRVGATVGVKLGMSELNSVWLVGANVGNKVGAKVTVSRVYIRLRACVALRGRVIVRACSTNAHVQDCVCVCGCVRVCVRAYVRAYVCMCACPTNKR